MQTFLPYPDFESVRLLDNKRLGKQRLECVQILASLYTGQGRSHPAISMWRGCERSLCDYTYIALEEWHLRGYRNDLTASELEKYNSIYRANDPKKPKWFGMQQFHRSHRISLLTKNFEFYSKHFKDPTEIQEARGAYFTLGKYRAWWPTEHGVI